MARPLREKLIERGWSEEEVKKAHQIMYGEERKPEHIIYKMNMNLVVYWTTLLVLTIANFLISIILIPFLLVIKPFFVELIVVSLGLILGLMFNHILRNIEHIEVKHHVAAAVFVPAVAIINIFVMVTIANAVAVRIKIPMQQNAVFVAIAYTVAFLLPYSIGSFREFLSRKKGPISQ